MRVRTMCAILCKTEKQNALALNTFSNAPELKIIPFRIWHPTPQMPVFWGKGGCPDSDTQWRYLWDEVQLPSPSAAHRVYMVQRLTIRDGTFLLDRTVKLTEERDSLMRSLPISHRAGSPGPFHEEVCFLLLSLLFFPFPKALKSPLCGQ